MPCAANTPFSSPSADCRVKGGETSSIEMDERSVTRRKTVNAVLIAALLLSLPGTGLLALAVMLSGLAAAGGGPTASSGDATLFVSGSALVFAASAAMLCWRGLASLISRCSFQFKPSWPNAAPRSPRLGAFAYDWICHVCEAANPAGQLACIACSAPPSLSMTQIDAAKEGREGNRPRPDTIPHMADQSTFRTRSRDANHAPRPARSVLRRPSIRK